MATELFMSDIAKANSINQATPLMAELAAKLEGNLIVASSAFCKRNFDSQFGDKNDTIKISIPKASTSADHSDSGNSATDFTQNYLDLKLDKYLTVDHEFTVAQWNNMISKGAAEVADSMIHGLSEAIESYAAQQFAYRAASYAGTPGTTLSAYSTFLDARKRMNLLKVPMMDRNVVLDQTSAAAALGLDQWKAVDVSGDTPALREASMGRRAGANFWESQFIWDTTANGTFEALNQTMAITADVSAVNAVYTDGTPYTLAAITEAGGASTTKISKGAQGYLTDNNGDVHYFTVLEQTAAAISGVVSAKITPALPADCTATVLVWAAKQKTTNVRNLLVQKDCVVLAARPLAPYPDRFSITMMSDNNIPIRLSMGSAMNTKKIWVSLDCLIKAEVLRPEGVVTIYG